MKIRSEDKNIERRMVSAPVEIETREDGTIGSIHGYAIVYNKDSEDMGFIERVAPGASKKALGRSDIRGLKNHDPSLIFARQGVNLKLTEDKKGLRYDATPIDTRNFKEIAEEVRTGLLTGQSFGFTILADEWKDLDTDHPKRTITEIGEIFDVGPVTFPAYQDTDVGLRSLKDAREAAKDIPDEKISITIKEETFDFTGESRFDDAAEKIKSLRSDSSPKTTDSDDTDSRSDDHTDSEVSDDILDEISTIVKGLKK